MKKTFVVSGDPSCAGSDVLYVICREDQMEGFLRRSGFGCSECRSYQEVSMIEIDDATHFITDKGTVFSKDSWRVTV